jgi:hypothetical protein
MKKINNKKTQSISGVMVNSISDLLLLPGAASSCFKVVTPILDAGYGSAGASPSQLDAKSSM